MTGKSSLIWSVRHHDREHDSFLVGTMHVSDKRAYVHFPQVLDRMSQVEAFYGEVDLDQGGSHAQVRGQARRQPLFPKTKPIGSAASCETEKG